MFIVWCEWNRNGNTRKPQTGTFIYIEQTMYDYIANGFAQAQAHDKQKKNIIMTQWKTILIT